MAIIPNDEKVFMVSNTTNTTYSGSQALKDMNEWYTMEDVKNTVLPYKVYTALLTQSGGDNFAELTSGSLTVGVTYWITSGSDGDFTNVGAPNNNTDTHFVATGDVPSSWGTSGSLRYNTGAPVVTFLENTIGNIWFTYNSDSFYEIILSNSIDMDKTFLYIGNGPTIGKTIFPGESGFKTISFPNESGSSSTLSLFGDKFEKTPIEIRVYN